MKYNHVENKSTFLDMVEEGTINDNDISLIEDTNEVYTHGRYYKRYEWEELGAPPVDGSTAKTLDVVFANKETGRLVIDGDWSVEKYPVDTYEPIGVVVIPGEHGVLKDGTGTKNQCGIMSIVPMSYETPEVGATTERTMYWGHRELDIGGKSDELGRYDSISNGLTNYQKVACDTSGSNTSTQLSSSSDGYLPRQESIGEIPTWNTNYDYIPSPYKANNLMSGAYNEAYGTTEFDTEGINQNALADFKGIVNTKIITDLATSRDWKNGSVSNISGSGYYPAACCCARFYTTGTKAFKDCSEEELKQGIGFWYLPACGELGYIIPRLADINDTINKLNQIYKVGVQLGTSSKYWSSSENIGSSRTVYTKDGRMNDDTKSSSYRTRAFMRL